MVWVKDTLVYSSFFLKKKWQFFSINRFHLIWFAFDVDFIRKLVSHAAIFFFYIKKRYCIHYYYIYPEIHFAPSFMRTRIVFPLQIKRGAKKTATSNRIYYYFRRLFILIQYPSEWIFLLLFFHLNNLFSIKIREKKLYQHPQCVISVNCIMGIIMVRKRSTLWIYIVHILILFEIA